MSAEEVIRPALTKAETELVLEALDDLSLASHDLDKMDQIRDICARLQSAAMRKSWRLES